MNTPEGSAILELQRTVFQRLAELDKHAPADVEVVLRMIVQHMRTWKPMSLLEMPAIPAATDL